PSAALETSYDRILALKAGLPPPTVDATAPTVGTPKSNLFSISAMGQSAVPVRSAWSASDGCGISGYALQRQVGSGAWSAQPLGSPTASAAIQSLAFGSVYRYR